VNKGVAANGLELNPLTHNEDPEAKEEDGGDGQEKDYDKKLWKHMDGKLFGGKVQFSKRGCARFWGKSLVGDFDTATNWIFLTEVHNHHLYYLVLASCIIATLLYLHQASDGFFGLLEKKLEKCY
jgi:hypothetical protein